MIFGLIELDISQHKKVLPEETLPGGEVGSLK